MLQNDDGGEAEWKQELTWQVPLASRGGLTSQAFPPCRVRGPLFTKTKAPAGGARQYEERLGPGPPQCQIGMHLCPPPTRARKRVNCTQVRGQKAGLGSQKISGCRV